MAQPRKIPLPRKITAGIHIQLTPPILPPPGMPTVSLGPVIAPPPKSRKSTMMMTKAMARKV
jgi:hypothetical protein